MFVIPRERLSAAEFLLVGARSVGVVVGSKGSVPCACSA